MLEHFFQCPHCWEEISFLLDTSDNHRSEERRVGKGVKISVDIGGRRVIKKKKKINKKKKKSSSSKKVGGIDDEQ